MIYGFGKSELALMYAKLKKKVFIIDEYSRFIPNNDYKEKQERAMTDFFNGIKTEQTGNIYLFFYETGFPMWKNYLLKTPFGDFYLRYKNKKYLEKFHYLLKNRSRCKR